MWHALPSQHLLAGTAKRAPPTRSRSEKPCHLLRVVLRAIVFIPARHRQSRSPMFPPAVSHTPTDVFRFPAQSRTSNCCHSQHFSLPDSITIQKIFLPYYFVSPLSSLTCGQLSRESDNKYGRELDSPPQRLRCGQLSVTLSCTSSLTQNPPFQS